MSNNLKSKHLWLRSEYRKCEKRTILTPKDAKYLMSSGFIVTVEENPNRIIDIDDYHKVGCKIVPQFSWTQSPKETFILGLKELSDDKTPLKHSHVMFGHSYKGQIIKGSDWSSPI